MIEGGVWLAPARGKSAWSMSRCVMSGARSLADDEAGAVDIARDYLSYSGPGGRLDEI